MVKIYLVDLLVWKNNLLPTKPTLSLRTGFKAETAHFPTFRHAANTRLNDMHKIPNPGS